MESAKLLKIFSSFKVAIFMSLIMAHQSRYAIKLLFFLHPR